MQSRFKMFASLSLSTALVGAGAALAVQDEGQTRPADEERKVAKVGEKAPNFTLTDINGKEHSLSDYEGKTVVLEWFNPECPYVAHLYRHGSFKTQGNELSEKDGFVWLAINSNPEGTQGGGKEKSVHYAKEYGIQYPVLLDDNSEVGRLYDARVTPHMYVINTEGVLVYAGAIDNAPLGNVRGGGEMVNYVEQALSQLAAGESISPDTTRPYGCTIKYQDAPGRSGERRRDGDRRQDGNQGDGNRRGGQRGR